MDSRITALGERVAALRAALGVSQRRFAQMAGVSGGYISAIESGQTATGAQMLLMLASQLPQLNCRWLLTGQGNMFQEVTPVLEGQQAPTRQDSVMPAISEVLIPELAEFQDVLKVARMGGQATQWAVLEAVQTAGSKGMTVADLCAVLGVAMDQVDGSVTTLKRKGIIRVSEGRCYLAASTVGLKAKEMENAAQHVRAALGMMVASVMPRVERGEQGSALVTTEVRLPSGMARDIAKRILGNTLAELAAAEEEEGTESLQVIMSFSTGATVTMPMPLKTT